MFKLYIDADAFPNLLKPIIIKQIERLKIKTIVVSKVAKHQNLPEILDEYAEKGYCIIGPLQVTNISSKYIYLYRRGRVDKDNVKILNENDKKGVQLYNGDWVYLLRKGERVILIKTRKKESKNE